MRFIFVLIVISVSVIAAPIPKSLKAKKPFDITGLWKLVGHSSNGKPLPHENMIVYWAFDDTSFQYYTDPNTKTDNSPTPLETPDPDKPQFKKMHQLPCAFERDGNQMRWVYCNEASATLEDCEPGKGRNQYIFELVK